jgi:hypothetical protein
VFTFDITSQNSVVTISKNTQRGGVVMEDTSDSGWSSCTCTGECFPSAHADYSEWKAVGSPLCWCDVRQCNGDTDNAAETKGNYWVYTNDLNLMLAAWGLPLGSLTGNQICADFAHDAETKGLYRVYTNDLNILLANWGTSNVPANCP